MDYRQISLIFSTEKTPSISICQVILFDFCGLPRIFYLPARDLLSNEIFLRFFLQYDKLRVAGGLRQQRHNNHEKIYFSRIDVSDLGLRQRSLAGTMPGERRLCRIHAADVHEKNLLHDKRALQ
jgi:hypothetical protein